MASKGRKKKGILSIPFLAGILVVLVVFAGITLNLTSNKDVKSASDFKPRLTGSEASTSGKFCLKNSRLTSFTLSGACENHDRDAFTKASYTCQDGSVGSIDSGCTSAPALLAQAKNYCAKTVCPSITLPPRPSVSPKPLHTTSLHTTH